jgi:hypothetical protein
MKRHPSAHREAKDMAELAHDIRRGRLPIAPETVLMASRVAAFLTAAGFASVSVLLALLMGLKQSLLMLLLTAISSILVCEAVKGYPRMLSRRNAAEVVKDSTSAINLMVMSLRREPSLSNAIAFSSSRKDSFSAELKACTWGVIMGRFASFEEALQSLGEHWSDLGSELKTAMNALITASCEATEDGRRRALDRANNAAVLGVKRRIEEYTLSLSTPSMIMFGLAILLPLMVGSFLPMMSWNVWTGSEGALAPGTGIRPIGLPQIVFIMNIMFPAIGLLVAMGSVTKHPLERRSKGAMASLRGSWRVILPTASCSLALVCLAVFWLEGVDRAAAALVCSTAPISAVLMYLGSRRSSSSHEAQDASEEALFRMGARMVEGQNYESALSGACKDDKGALKVHVEGSLLGGSFHTFDERVWTAGKGGSDGKVYEAFRVVREAAAKDERAAGLLAMDLATYIRDLRETERSLRSRLKPTIAMMRMTSFVLAPVVLGVTFAMYMTLGAIAEGGMSSLGPGTFLLVLGVFLAESNAIVQYFVWGIEGRSSSETLVLSLGSCVLVSEILFVATAIIAG